MGRGGVREGLGFGRKREICGAPPLAPIVFLFFKRGKGGFDEEAGGEEERTVVHPLLNETFS